MVCRSVSDLETAALAALGARFMAALALKNTGKLDDAEDELRAILRIEPRLAEPRMELTRLLLDTDRVSAAEPHAREALEQLQIGGPWTEEIGPNVVMGLAHGILAEVLRRRADEDDVIFGDPATFKALVKESQDHFVKASELDPSDEYSSYHAFFMGVGPNDPTR